MPASLRAAVDAALEGAGAERDRVERTAVPDQLARAGLSALARVIRSRPDRSAAIELLAADALLTYACEAAAEAGPDALDRLLRALALPRFESLLEEVGP